MVETILINTTPYGKIMASHEGSLHSSTLKDKYPNFEVGLKCILMVNPCLIVCSYIK